MRPGLAWTLAFAAWLARPPHAYAEKLYSEDSQWNCACQDGAWDKTPQCTRENSEDCVVNETATMECHGLSNVCSCVCTVQGDVKLEETAKLSCEEDSLCSLRVDVVNGSVTMTPGSTVKLSTFVLNVSGDVLVEAGALINGTAQGLFYRPDSIADATGFGGSNGGFGGKSSCLGVYSYQDSEFSNPVTPWSGWIDFDNDDDGRSGYGYGGAGKTLLPRVPGGRGGGRIAIIAKGGILLRGVVTAEGGNAPSSCDTDCGSGAGGTIFLNATTIQDSDSSGNGKGNTSTLLSPNAFPPAMLSVAGGESTRPDSGAGGGGRIALLAREEILLHNTFITKLHGGYFRAKVTPSNNSARKKSISASNLGSCLGGGAGSILRATFSANHSTYLASLQIANCPLGIQCERQEFVDSPSPFTLRIKDLQSILDRENVMLLSMAVSKYATVNSTKFVLDYVDKKPSSIINSTHTKRPLFGPRNTPGITLDYGRLRILSELKSPSLELRSGSTVFTGDGALLNIYGGTLSLDQTSDIFFRGNLGIDVAQYANISGSIRANKDVPGSQLHMFAKFLRVKGNGIQSDKITIVSDAQVEIAAKIAASLSSDCAGVSHRSLCEELAADNVNKYRKPQWLRDHTTDKLANYSFVTLVKRSLPHSRFSSPSQWLAMNEISANVTLRNDLTLYLEGEVSAQSVLMCSDSMRIVGNVKTSGQGCRADYGPGAGCTSANAGGGGGHGGFGGAGIGCFDRGKPYDSFAVPILSGSGGGGSGPSIIGGGNGGGVAVIGSSRVLEFDGQILADGQNGNSQLSSDPSAGGGGAGGSIIISAPTICSSPDGIPLLSSNGGDGGAGGGGGGGGGRIAIEFSDEVFLTKSAEFSLPFGSACTHYGNFTATVQMDGGRQGVVPPGTFPKRIEPALKDKDRAGTTGTVHSPDCGEGHGGNWCEFCEMGYYKDKVGPGTCAKCRHRQCIDRNTCSWMAEGSTSSDCPVLCNPGYVQPNCVSPLENLIASMGGIVVFASVIASFGLLIVITFTCVCTRVEWCPGYYAKEAKFQRKRLRTALALREHRRQLGFLNEDENDMNVSLLQDGDGASGSEAGFSNSPGAASLRMGAERDLDGEYSEFLPLRSDRRRGKLRRAGLSQSKYKVDLEGMDRLSEADIPFHLTRVYFSGNNSPENPWCLPRRLPPILRGSEYLDESKYGEMADKVNKLAKHSFMSSVFTNIFRILCYPLGYLYMRRQRHVCAHRILKFFETYNHECVRNTRARTLMNTFKFGKDKHSTLAYVDVLASKPVQGTHQQQERLPLLLFLSGDGSYWNPFYIDWSDLLVRAIPHLVELRTFIDQAWADMVMTHLNAALRPVDPSMIDSTVQPAVRIIERYQSQEHDLMGGLKVRLGLFATPGEEDSGGSDPKQRRLALLLMRDERFGSSFSTPVSNGNHPVPRSLEDYSTNMGVTEVQSTPLRSGSFSNQSSASSINVSMLLGDMLSNNERPVGAALVEAFEQEERLRSSVRNRNNSIANGSDDDENTTQNSVHSPSRWSLGNANGSPDHSVLQESSNGVARRERLGEVDIGPSFQHQQQADSSYNNQQQQQLGEPDLSHGNSFVDLESTPFIGRILVRRRSEEFDIFDGEQEYVARGASGADSDESNASSFSLGTELRKFPSFVRRTLGILLNRPPRKRDSQLFSRMYFSLLLALDISITFFLLTTFYCVNHQGEQCTRTLFVLILAIYPFALVLGPMLGLTFVVFPLSGMGRQYAVWNALSMINALIACILSVIYKDKFSFQAGLFSSALLIVKFLQSRAVDWYIALVELDRGRSKNRN